MDPPRILSLLILCVASARAHVTTAETAETSETTEKTQQVYHVLDNQVVDQQLQPTDLDLKRYREFRRFLMASSRREEEPSSLFLRPFSRGRVSTSEERLSGAEARALLFRGAPPGRPVPLSVDDLLPDRCQMLPFEETIFHPGCDNSTISTNFCYGLCSSLFVPLFDEVIAMCHACAPTKFKSVAVDLHCPGGDSVRKHIRVVTACGCVPCESKGGVFG